MTAIVARSTRRGVINPSSLIYLFLFLRDTRVLFSEMKHVVTGVGFVRVLERHRLCVNPWCSSPAIVVVFLLIPASSKVMEHYVDNLRPDVCYPAPFPDLSAVLH